jgi:ABC-type dipeptide/oligopeptide/nickel transport system permease subunit
VKLVRRVAIAVLTIVALASLAADILAPYDYAAQDREHPNEPPSRAFLLGTDELGRDRFSRLLYATRVSVVLAPATALAATAFAALAGLAAGYRTGWVDGLMSLVGDLFLSLPWLFVLLTLRALLPLDVPPVTSLLVTAALLASVGWAAGARVVRASVSGLRDSPPVTQARAYGSTPFRILLLHILPNLRPVLSAQFWILVPAFLLTEANLGLLGLGITEPMPSLGNMLAELQAFDRILDAPWIVAPAVVVFTTVGSLHFVVSGNTSCER